MWSEQGTWIALAMLMIPGFSVGNENTGMRQRHRQGVERLDERCCADAEDEGTVASTTKSRGKPAGQLRATTGM